jgi:hypothetical protein
VIPDRRYTATPAPDDTWTVIDHAAPHTYTAVCTVVAPDTAGQPPGSAVRRRAHWIAQAFNAYPEATR